MNNMTWNENLEFPTNIINLLIPIFKNTSWKLKNGENTFIFGIQTDKGVYKIEVPLEHWNKFEVEVVSEIELNKEIDLQTLLDSFNYENIYSWKNYTQPLKLELEKLRIVLEKYKEVSLNIKNISEYVIIAGIFLELDCKYWEYCNALYTFDDLKEDIFTVSIEEIIIKNLHKLYLNTMLQYNWTQEIYLRERSRTEHIKYIDTLRTLYSKIHGIFVKETMKYKMNYFEYSDYKFNYRRTQFDDILKIQDKVDPSISKYVTKAHEFFIDEGFFIKQDELEKIVASLLH